MKFEESNINEIRRYLTGLPQQDWAVVSEILLTDRRAAVRNLGENLKGKINKMNLEWARLETMVRNEKELAMGARVICGVDEAGRGPLAGPVVAAAVILPDGYMPVGLNDSKKVPEVRRESLYDQITENALAWGVGIVGPQRIDEINILEATREAMMIAVGQMGTRPDFVLLDAVEIKNLDIVHKGIIKGDEKCLSIAAASIIAKVTRDRIMTDLGCCFPQYGFQIHKGYGTTVHYDALNAYGLTEHHRRSFLKSWKE